MKVDIKNFEIDLLSLKFGFLIFEIVILSLKINMSEYFKKIIRPKPAARLRLSHGKVTVELMDLNKIICGI